MTVSPRLESALTFAERGIPVFPLRPRSKVPATPNGFRDATRERERIETYWSRRRDANVGVVTGSMPLVLDVDPRHGGDESLAELERSNEPLPRTVRVTTGGGGEHHYLQAHIPIPSSAGKLGPGLDVKGIGGYVVGPGSVHESGRQYTFDRSPETKRAPVGEWQRISKGVAEGGRNDAAARLYGHLLAKWLDPVVAFELMLGWNRRCKPPLRENELRRTCESIADAERRKGAR